MDLALRATEGTLKCSMEVDGCDAREEDGTGQLFKLFKLLRLFRLVKLLRLFKIMRLFERYQDDLFKYMHIISVAKLVVFMLYLGHLFGCFFHYFSVSEWRTAEERARTARWNPGSSRTSATIIRRDGRDRYIASTGRSPP